MMSSFVFYPSSWGGKDKPNMNIPGTNIYKDATIKCKWEHLVCVWLRVLHRDGQRERERSRLDRKYFSNYKIRGRDVEEGGSEKGKDAKREGELQTELRRETPLIIQQALQISNTVKPPLCWKRIKQEKINLRVRSSLNSLGNQSDPPPINKVALYTVLAKLLTMRLIYTRHTVGNVTLCYSLPIKQMQISCLRKLRNITVLCWKCSLCPLWSQF